MPEVMGGMARCLLQEQVEGNASLLLSPLPQYTSWQQLIKGHLSGPAHCSGKSPHSSLCWGKSTGCSSADAARGWDASSAVAVVYTGWGEAPTLLSRSRSSALPCRSRSPGVFGLDTFTTR